MKRLLTALLYRTRCDRQVLLPMIEELDPRQLAALWRLLEVVREDGEHRGRRSVPWFAGGGAR